MTEVNLNGDDDVFEEFKSGDDITIHYDIRKYPNDDTKVSTTIVNFADNDELVWKAGKTGNGRITKNGQVIDGNGVKIGLNASIEHNQ